MVCDAFRGMSAGEWLSRRQAIIDKRVLRIRRKLKMSGPAYGIVKARDYDLGPEESAEVRRVRGAKRGRPVVNDRGDTFASAVDAGIAAGVTPAAITHAIKRGSETGGRRWFYAEAPKAEGVAA